jgi:predicted ATP-grasp superfamily ATP-dependent carboligase
MAHRILVTDAEQRKSVPIVRALGRHGLQVVCGESSRWSMGFYSRYCTERKVYPKPEDEERFVEWLIQQADAGEFSMLLPIDERTMTPVTKHLDELRKHMRVPVVEHATYMIARDKGKTVQQAMRLGVPVPRTWFFSSLDEFRDGRGQVEYPCIVKARSSSGSNGIRQVLAPADLERLYLQVHRDYPFPLVQEFIPPGGDTFGVELLLDRGKVLAHFMHRRLREFPVHGGPSTLRESVYIEDLLRKASDLLVSIGWHGVAMVEFKVDPRDRVPKLMEINPKFWGSIALAIAAGVNFPVLLYQLAAGERMDRPAGYRLNVRCRWLLPGDIMHFVANPQRWHLKPSFFDFRGEFDDLLEREDWRPVYGMLMGFGSKLLRKRIWTEKIFRPH